MFWATFGGKIGAATMHVARPRCLGPSKHPCIVCFSDIILQLKNKKGVVQKEKPTPNRINFGFRPYNSSIISSEVGICVLISHTLPPYYCYYRIMNVKLFTILYKTFCKWSFQTINKKHNMNWKSDACTFWKQNSFILNTYFYLSLVREVESWEW